MWSRLPFGERLRAELGTPRGARRLGSSPRSRVWRAELAGTPVVVKQLRAGPGADDRYARETAALRIAARAEPPVAPRLLGADPAARLLVLEHLEHGTPHEDWVVDHAAALARLHASAGPGDGDTLPAWTGPAGEDVEAFLRLARTLGAVVPAGARAELDGLADRLARLPGRALLHGDPCPGNDLHTGQGVRFVDFEQASRGPGIVELAYLRIGFPTCWCATAPAPERLAAAEAAYRAQWRASTGTEVDGDLADACAGWLVRGDALVQRARRGTADHLARIPRRDWTWGTATARQRLAHRLRTVGRLTASRDLARLTTAMYEGMLARWPGLRPLPERRP
ncbi:aminoglycoside phosphotransferase [Streptomyces sp. NRRL B-24484]|uniref:aminoglycoside phosphotransferase n=1 Tax=Streptomyces sp. NRRL B-24484 TaxID=1463833 RepID=UPI0004C0ACDD|nr:aminoglycoside phosphotransferase [Streptomyces sp. NRRL B-24484]